MFDIGFSEVLLIFVIALVVLGPEKLPRLASQLGRWIGRARTMARQFREQLEEEVNLENVRKAHKEAEARAKEAGAGGAGAAAGVAGSSTSVDAGVAGGGEDASGTGASAMGAGGAGGSGGDVLAGDATTGGGVNSGAGGSGSAGASQAEPWAQTQAMPGAFTSAPDPVDFRADTFSHAHPTNEFGANPETANGAAEAPPQSATPVPAQTHGAGAGAASPAQNHTQRANGSDAYTPSTHTAAEPAREAASVGTTHDTHGQS